MKAQKVRNIYRFKGSTQVNEVVIVLEKEEEVTRHGINDWVT